MIRGDERGFLEKAKEYSRRGVRLTILEKAPSMVRRAETSCSSIEVGNVVIPLNGPLGMVRLCFDSLLRTLWTGEVRPSAIYAYNQDPENVVTGFLLKLVYRSQLVVVYHQLPDSYFLPLNLGVVSRRARGFGILSSLWGSIVPALGRYGLTHADIHLALSEATKHDLASLGITDCVVVGNGLDTYLFRRLDVEKRYEAVFLGRLVYQKGIDVLLRAWKEVNDSKPGSRLVLLGGGEGRDISNYTQLIRELGLEDNVKLTGFVEDEDIVRFLNESRLFVFPSRKEGFAQAVSQAMACGLCCILSDIPSLREVYGNAAYFVPPEDSHELARKILTLLADESSMSQTGARAMTFVKKFSWADVVDKETGEIFRDVHDKNHPESLKDLRDTRQV